MARHDSRTPNRAVLSGEQVEKRKTALLTILRLKHKEHLVQHERDQWIGKQSGLTGRTVSEIRLGRRNMSLEALARLKKSLGSYAKHLEAQFKTLVRESHRTTID